MAPFSDNVVVYNNITQNFSFRTVPTASDPKTIIKAISPARSHSRKIYAYEIPWGATTVIVGDMTVALPRRVVAARLLGLYEWLFIVSGEEEV